MIKEILKEIGTAYYVGGYVRDKILGIDSKDIDIEVFGLSYEYLADLLKEFGKVDLVGKSFGVLKVNINGQDYDFNLPRRDSKNGIGHKGFSIEVDHSMTIEEAASRRDFTINSISMDREGNIIDPFNGVQDIKNRILQPTSEAFKEDSLRVLRGFQFAARFNMVASEKCKEYSKEMIAEYSDLPKERIWEEWKKWASKGNYYTASLKYLKDSGWISLYPALNALFDLEQDNVFHPEGSVYKHTGLVLDHIAQVCKRERISGENRLVLVFAALCHDMGKAVCTERKYSEKYQREVVTSYQHEKLGVPIAEEFLQSIGCPISIIKKVLPLVEYHMVLQVSSKIVKKLSEKVEPASILELCYVIEADQCGRHPLPKKISDNLIHLYYIAKKEGVLYNKPEKIVSGQDVVDFGYGPGPITGKIVKKLYQMQLNESFQTKEQGLSRIHSFVRSL